MEKENCHVEPVDKPMSEEALNRANRTLMEVGGMGCTNCAQRVRNSLLALQEVIAVDVYLEEGMAVVYHEPGLGVSTLEEAVFRAGNDGHHPYRARVLH